MNITQRSLKVAENKSFNSGSVEATVGEGQRIQLEIEVDILEKLIAGKVLCPAELCCMNTRSKKALQKIILEQVVL